jgi:hypothetical protein
MRHAVKTPGEVPARQSRPRSLTRGWGAPIIREPRNAGVAGPGTGRVVEGHREVVCDALREPE